VTAKADSTRRAAYQFEFAKTLWVGSLLANLFVVGMAFLIIAHNRQQSINEAKFQTKNYSAILGEDLAGFLRNIDNTLLTVVDEFSREQIQGGIRDGEFQALLDREYARVPEALGLRVLDAKGNSIFGSGDVKAPHVNLGDRPYFIRNRDNSNAGLVISEPVMSRISGQWVITLSRRLNNPDGTFAGETHFAIATNVLVAMLAKLDLGAHGNSGLWDKTTLIARYAKDDPNGAKTGAQTPSTQLHALLVTGTKATFYQARSGIDGISRLYYFQQVGDYPLYTVVGLADKDYLVEWRQDSLHIAEFAGFFVVGTFFFTWLVHSAWRRHLNAQSEVTRLSQWNELLLNSAGEGIYGVDLNGRCTFINPAALTMLGFERDEVIGRNQHQLFHHHRKDGIPYAEEDCPIYITLRDGIRREAEDSFIRKNGELFSVQLTVAPMHENGALIGAEVVFQDITQRKLMEAELVHLATTDSLTEIANRRFFLDQLEIELARIQRFGGEASLLMVDLDHFKKINDSYGHAAGDLVLRHFANLTRQSLRRIDVFGRLGGEEFGILLPGTDTASTVQFAERLRNLIADTPAPTNKGLITFTISIGISKLDSTDQAGDTALVCADMALYEAKEKGRNVVHVYESDPAEPEALVSDGKSLIHLSWKPSYACGEPTIDMEHRQLFRLANALLDHAMANGKDASAFNKAFDDMLSHVVKHFSDEEEILRTHGYERLEEHASIHKRLVDRALSLQRQANDSGVSMDALIQFLVSDVVVGHLLREDRDFFGLFAKTNQVV